MRQELQHEVQRSDARWLQQESASAVAARVMMRACLSVRMTHHLTAPALSPHAAARLVATMSGGSREGERRTSSEERDARGGESCSRS